MQFFQTSTCSIHVALIRVTKSRFFLQNRVTFKLSLCTFPSTPFPSFLTMTRKWKKGCWKWKWKIKSEPYTQNATHKIKYWLLFRFFYFFIKLIKMHKCIYLFASLFLFVWNYVAPALSNENYRLWNHTERDLIL